MNDKVLRVLEYNKIIDQLTDKATSEQGKKLTRNLVPMTDQAAITAAQTQTADALTRLFHKGSTSFGGNKDLGMCIKSMEIGSVLSIAELLRIASFLENVNRIKSYGRKDREDVPADSLDEYFDILEPLTPLANEIRRCILSEEEIADDASPTLKHIRRSMSITNDRIHSQLNSMINGSCRTYLQDAVVTMRNNRYCIPVKSEYKGQVQGMVHDQSSTGSTFFIEPAAVVSLNNELRELEIKEQEEIAVILADLSAQAGTHTQALTDNQKAMTTLDFIFAKAALAMEQNAAMPVFNTDHRIRIRQGRHPLLDKKKVVPIDISLGADFDLLVITGPNTGGKTVSLKTVGLLTLMGQAGLHIPALDRSELSIFEEVYADIGDEQSIEQNLSTFSSHMTNIVSILQTANTDSLCLFDELGAGTDPTEGAALAIAVLDYLHCRGIRTMATTHYSELKVYALSTDFVENASCEFSVETLQPTYRLLIGIPGKSNAFAISSKLGLPDHIIEDARKHITEDKESKARILREANEEAREILQNAKDLADETIRTFQKAGASSSIKDLEKSRQKVRDKITEKNDKLSLKADKPAHKPLKPSQIKLGESVRIVSMGLKGTISSLPDKNGRLFVQCGIIRSQVSLDDLVLAEEETIKTGRMQRSSSGKLKMSKSYSVSTEINLLGKTVDEALSELDKYLDDAYLAHLPSVRIVHGKGTGALRNAVHNYLRKNKVVKSYRLGEFGEGDAGVTIAEFKD